jgi:hypothetical protein
MAPIGRGGLGEGSQGAGRVTAPLAGAALPEALRNPGYEEAHLQVGSGRTGNENGQGCASPPRALAIARVIADVAELVRRAERRAAA